MVHRRIPFAFRAMADWCATCGEGPLRILTQCQYVSPNLPFYAGAPPARRENVDGVRNAVRDAAAGKTVGKTDVCEPTHRPFYFLYPFHSPPLSLTLSVYVRAF